MFRRLYFVLPNSRGVADIVGELQDAGVDREHISVASRNPAQVQIPGVQIQDATTDRGERIEHSLWNLNLLVFFLAALGLLVILAARGLTPWLFIPAGIMLATFVAGLRFTHVPNTHLHEFTPALRHGELVLMVNVPLTKVAEIEDLVHRHHPDAAVGGVGWSSDLLRA